MMNKNNRMMMVVVTVERTDKMVVIDNKNRILVLMVEKTIEVITK